LRISYIQGQDKGLFRDNFLEAEYFFLDEEYEEALHLYTELLKTDPTNYNLDFLTGACYLSLYGQKSKAIPYLEQAANSVSAGYREGSYKERNAPRESIFALARAYHINNQFDRAIEYYEKYRNVMIKNKFADIEYVNAQIKSCELAESMITKPIEVKFVDPVSGVNRLSINYHAVFSGNDSLVIYITKKPLYHAIQMSRISEGKWSDPVILNDDLGSDGDCFPTSLSFDGKELYLVKKNQSEADIYISRFIKGHWTKIEKLNANINSEYYESHASISSNGSKLYFTSDRPGGQGALDIWVSDRSPEGVWGEARNLGPKVNSFYSEDTPFITPDGQKLYFSSQGHATMGGYDIFISSWLADGTWSFPENIGYPVSTSDDDLFYVPRRHGELGYFSTIIDTLSVNRNIYAVRIGHLEDIQIGIRKQKEGISDTTKEKYLASDEGKYKEAGKEGEKVPDRTIEKDLVSGEGKTQETGKDREEVPGRITEKDQISGEEKSQEAGKLEHLPADQYYVLNNIMFDFNSHELDEAAHKEADRIIEVLIKYPEINIELTGHTDAVGVDEYNIRLSKNRADAVADYLIKKGVSRERITTKGIGEANPAAVNKYEDGTDSPEGRKLNRHVSIRLSNLSNENISVEEIFVPQVLKPRIGMSYSILLVSSETEVKDMPEKIGEEEIVLIITDRAFLYTAGNFTLKADAVKLLNNAIDNGFPGAQMMEKEDLEDLVKSLSDSTVSVSATFTIQIMALRKPVSIDYFSNLENVTMFIGNDGLHRYVYGNFQSMSEALKELPRIRKMGYKDAFIVYMERYKKAADK
jgi:outer membrane protein OmpA-like peptidoglycan-associated protein